MSNNSLLARARRASTDEQKLALYFELISALAAHEREERIPPPRSMRHGADPAFD